MYADLLYDEPTTHEEWLEFRKKSIGGSDASAVVEQNPYFSRYALWYEKTRKDNPTEEMSEAMRQGHDLEEYVATRFSELTGKRVETLPKTIRNPRYPFAHANVDRVLVDEDALLECKTTNMLNMKKFDEGEYPANYYLQCLHYLGVTGCQRCYLAVLIFGKDFKVFVIERDEEMISDLMEAEKNFWSFVEQQIPPPVDGSDSTKSVLQDQYSEVEDEDIELFNADGVFEELLDLKRKRKVLDTEIQERNQRIEAMLGNAERGHTERYLATWKEQVRRTFDVKKYLAENDVPDLDKYYKESSSRVLRVKELADG